MDMFGTIAECTLHNDAREGDSLTMQNNPVYENIISEITSFFEEKIQKLKSMGFNKIIIVGFRFGKQ